jgi:hypothetical protein
MTVACAVAGCGVAAPQPFTTTPLDESSRVLTSAHFKLVSTVPEVDGDRDMIRTLEAAVPHYAEVTGLGLPSGRLSGFVFPTRSQMQAFTRKRLGPDAPELWIGRGGYTAGDWFAVQALLPRDALVTLAHEGFHVYCNAKMKSRLPVVIEEGAAAMFESISVSDRGVSIDTSANPQRQRILARVVAQDQLLTLADLLKLDAAQATRQTVADVERFYAQAWALAMFLRTTNGPGGPALRQLFADAARGTLSPTQKSRDSLALIEVYTGLPTEQLERDYAQYLRRLAATE